MDKKIKFRNILAAALVAAILASSVISCGDEKAPADTTVSIGETTIAQTEPKSTEIPDNLPDDIDFGGRRFRIGYMNPGEYIAASVVLEETGDVVNDAVYKANIKVCERFNIVLEPIELAGNSLDPVKAAVLAGDNAYEVCNGHDLTIANLSLTGIFRDINSLPYLDYEKPWWPSYSVDSITVNGHMMLIANYMSYWILHVTSLFYANKQLMQDYGLEMPYDAVREGRWTLDMLVSQMKDVYEDLNGNGERDDDDRYGWVSPMHCYGLQESFGIAPIKEDENGVLYIDIASERNMNIINDIISALKNTDGGYVSEVYDTPGEIFIKGNSLYFRSAPILAATTLRESDVEYGIVPVPKYDEIQEEYISGSADRPFAVPITVDNDEFIGVIVEAMSAEGYKTVRLAYFDIALKNKYSYDEDSAEMLDIISNTIVIDFSYLYSDYGGFAWMLMDMLDPKNKNDFASYVAKNEKRAQKRVDKLNEFFAGLAG
ncbi:MAG: hypothetical protein ACOX4O_05950 [Eubacteriales bacterium]|jgi:hypothetical protein